MYENEIGILKQALGDNWLEIVQDIGTKDLRSRVGKEFTSFMSFPIRGDGGDNLWRGNCSPEVVYQLLKFVLEHKRYYGKDTSRFLMMDLMSGSGTSKDAADRLQVPSFLYDLNPSPRYGQGGFDALNDDIEESADFIFLHPPYHNMIRFSGNMWGAQPHPADLSQCRTYEEFMDKLNFILKKSYMALRKDGWMAVLVGDIRIKGQFYAMHEDIIKIGTMESFIVKAQHHCKSDNRSYRKPFIPVVCEYILLTHKEDSFLIPISRTIKQTFDLRTLDHPSVTWNHLIRMTMESLGGAAELKQLYQLLAPHPKAQINQHYRERIRATIYEHPNLYELIDDKYRLRYFVA